MEKDNILTFFIKYRLLHSDFSVANSLIRGVSGIKKFFSNEEEIKYVYDFISSDAYLFLDKERAEYGDFQTSHLLANCVTENAYKVNSDIEFVLEPTCGTGTFILTCLSRFKHLKKIVGIELYKPYVWITKLKILNYYLSHDLKPKLDIDIIQFNIFDFNFETLAFDTKDLKILINMTGYFVFY
jgi:hypothetical protein